MVCESCGTVFCCDDADLTALSGQKQLYCSKTCKKKARRARTAEQHRQEKRLAACKEHGKYPYPRVAEARAAAARQFAGRSLLLYPYLCPCGWWHLTKQPQPVPDEYEWFRVSEVDSPAFRNWLARSG